MNNERTISEGNTDQFKAWDGDEGTYWALHADEYDASLRAQHALLMSGADIGDSDNVLDIGCGAGATTCDAAVLAPHGKHLGIDLSSKLLAVAKERSAQRNLSNVEFVQADAQVYPFDPVSFDVVISRTGAMFFADQSAAFTNICRAMRPGGRLVLLTWQAFSENTWLSRFRRIMAAGRDMPDPPPPNRPGPFALSQPDHVRELLTSTGFEDVGLEGLRPPMYFGDDVDSAEEFLVGQFGWMLEGVDEETRAQTLGVLRKDLSDHLTDDGVAYESASWLITATRT